LGSAIRKKICWKRQRIRGVHGKNIPEPVLVNGGSSFFLFNKELQMTKTAEIQCINKNPRHDPYNRITHVGGHTGNKWKVTTDRAIDMIEQEGWRFYVTARGHTVWVVVASRNGRKYLKTEADGDTPDNLLSLPECP
jgi:hypothetical protein